MGSKFYNTDQQKHSCHQGQSGGEHLVNTARLRCGGNSLPRFGLISRPDAPRTLTFGPFKWRQFEPEVILLAVGWYLRFSLSYRDVEELLAERGR
jgi:hypothetical protein